MNLLLDTNVLIDYLGRKPPFFEAAEKLIASGYFGDTKLWASATSYKDAFYVLSKFIESNRVQQAIADISEVITVVNISGNDILRATQLGWKDMEDCLISISAEKTKADYIVTRDADGFDKSSVKSIDPDSLLELLPCKYSSIQW